MGAMIARVKIVRGYRGRARGEGGMARLVGGLTPTTQFSFLYHLCCGESRVWCAAPSTSHPHHHTRSVSGECGNAGQEDSAKTMDTRLHEGLSWDLPKLTSPRLTDIARSH